MKLNCGLAADSEGCKGKVRRDTHVAKTPNKIQAPKQVRTVTGDRGQTRFLETCAPLGNISSVTLWHFQLLHNGIFTRMVDTISESANSCISRWGWRNIAQRRRWLRPVRTSDKLCAHRKILQTLSNMQDTRIRAEGCSFVEVNKVIPLTQGSFEQQWELVTLWKFLQTTFLSLARGRHMQ